MIDYRCSCGKAFRLTDDLAGKQVECCFCGKTGLVHGSGQKPLVSPAAPALPVPRGRLASFGELWGRAWGDYKSRVVTLFLIIVLSVILMIFSFSGALIAKFAADFLKDFQKPAALAAFVLTFVSFLAAASWSSAAFFYAVAREEAGPLDAFRETKGKILPFFWIMTLLAFISFGGHLLLVIPGIIFTVWFFFAPFVYVEEEVSGMDALMRSREYVRGLWLPVALRLFVVWLLSVLVAVIPVLGQILALLIIPFVFVHGHALYKNLREVRGSVPPPVSAKAKAGVLVTSALGFILIPVLVMFLFGAMLGGMFLKIMSAFQKGGLQAPPVSIMQVSPGSGTTGSSLPATPFKAPSLSLTVYVFALNYKGKVTVNDKVFYEFEGKPNMSYNMSGSGTLKPGKNVIEVDYEPKPTDEKFMKPEIKIEIYSYDWNNNQKNTIQEWKINSAEPGKQTFEYELPSSVRP